MNLIMGKEVVLMQVTIDISMYPNREEFIPPIDGFIEKD